MSTVVADRAVSFMSGARDRSVVTPAAPVVRRGRGDESTLGRRMGSARTIVWASSRSLTFRLGVCVLLCYCANCCATVEIMFVAIAF